MMHQNCCSPTRAVCLLLLLIGSASAARALCEDPRPAPISPLAVDDHLDPKLVELGRILFHDPRLSRDATVACSSCHNILSGGDDGLPRSVGVDGQVGLVNAPSVLNSSFNFALFWDGRAATLEEQVDGPLTDALEMDANWDLVLPRLKTDPELSRLFLEFGGKGVSADLVRSAIAEFERSLVTENGPFDRFLCGEDRALSEKAQKGYQLFLDFGCVSCHQGRNVGGNMYQRFGVVGDYFEDRGEITKADYGRFNVTGRESDRFVFRVPSLRNVADTAPYFHDGSVDTLPKAVRIMARYQLGKELSNEETQLLVAFLTSLSGPIHRDAAP